MSMVSILAVIAGISLLAFMMLATFKVKPSSKRSWIFPAALSMLYLIFSLLVVLSEGPLGFWSEHTLNMWGNQIWFDLLLAVGIGWYLIVPQARVLKMRLLPWSLLIVCTGCIGFLAMLSRLLYLREHPKPGLRTEN